MSDTSIATLGRRCEITAVGRGRRVAVTASVHEEVRDNLIAEAARRHALFPGIVGYDDTVVPQLVNALLSQHNFILLGLRGQAKTRLLRALVDLLDERIPVMPGCEINDDPLRRSAARAGAQVAEDGDQHADRLARPRGPLRGEAGDARRDHRRHDRRHRPDQGGARRACSCRTS